MEGHDCTRSEHPVEELRPAGGIIVRRLQVALACTHAVSNAYEPTNLQPTRIPQSASSCGGVAQWGSPLKHCGARGTRTAAAGSNLPHLRGERREDAPNNRSMYSRMPHDSFMVILSWSVSTGTLQAASAT